MSYAYERSGHPLLKWGMTAPSQTRAPVGSSLGGLVLPLPGAPEPINGAMGACACHKTSAMSGILDTVSGLSLPVKIAGAVGIVLLYKHLRK